MLATIDSLMFASIAGFLLRWRRYLTFHAKCSIRQQSTQNDTLLLLRTNTSKSSIETNQIQISQAQTNQVQLNLHDRFQAASSFWSHFLECYRWD